MGKPGRLASRCDSKQAMEVFSVLGRQGPLQRWCGQVTKALQALGDSGAPAPALRGPASPGLATGDGCGQGRRAGQQCLPASTFLGCQTTFLDGTVLTCHPRGARSPRPSHNTPCVGRGLVGWDAGRVEVAVRTGTSTWSSGKRFLFLSIWLVRVQPDCETEQTSNLLTANCRLSDFSPLLGRSLQPRSKPPRWCKSSVSFHFYSANSRQHPLGPDICVQLP